MTALGPRTRWSWAAAPGRRTIPFCECANTTPTEPSCGIRGGAGGRWGLSHYPGRPSRPFREAPWALLRAQGSAGSGPRAWGQGVCCSACRTARLEAAAVPVASPLSAGCWGGGAPSPLPIPPPRPPPLGLLAPTSLLRPQRSPVRGRGWGLAFVPALCRALPRWPCVRSAWPSPDPSAGPAGRP